MRSAGYIHGPRCRVCTRRRDGHQAAKDICKAKRSITGDYLSGRKRIAVPQTRRTGSSPLSDRRTGK